MGETGVVSRTIDDLIPEIDATAVDSPHVARIKGQARMATAVANAVKARERIPSTLPTTRVNGIDVPLLAADVDHALATAHGTRKPHNKARGTFLRTMMSTLRTRYVESVDYTPERDELDDVESQLMLNDYAGLADDIVVIGVGTRAEIWNRASWESYLSDKEQGYSDIADDVLPAVDF